MRTPFCTAVRIAEQAVDEVRLAIAEGQEELCCLDARASVMLAANAAERALAARRVELPETGWFDRQARARSEVTRRRELVDLALTELRDDAAARLASLKALQAAAEQFRAAERKRHARREQAEADDRSALLFRTSYGSQSPSAAA